MLYLVVYHSNVTFFLVGVVTHSKILNVDPFERQLLQTRHKAKTIDSEERSSGFGSKMTFSERDSEASIKININISIIKLTSIFKEI